MEQDDRPVLVIGATGFLGRQVVVELLGRGDRVRCLVREPGRAGRLVGDRVEVVRGDMMDAHAVARAAGSARAVVVCVHTLSRQPGAERGSGYLQVEEAGLRAVIAACQAQQVGRLLYVTSIGVDAAARSSWLRGRARTEQLLMDSGLDVTVVRPGIIVGSGGAGFGVVERGARGRVALVLAGRSQRFRVIGVGDLARLVVDLLDDPRSLGRAFDVGSDDVLTMDQMIDLAADHLGRRRPLKLHLPRRLVGRLAPLLERAARLPPAAVAGLVGEGSDADLVGDISPVRALSDQVPTSYAQLLAALMPPDTARSHAAADRETAVTSAPDPGRPSSTNTAAWLPTKAASLEVGSAPVPRPGPGEVVVRARAVAVNPVDWVVQVTGGLGFGWLRYPAVTGYDVAGDVLAVGEGVDRVDPGDRVTALAVGAERGHRAREGAFQEQVVVQQHLLAPLPPGLAYEEACVVPLATATAACGLFQAQHLGLRLPPADAGGAPRVGESVLIWGGSTSVGGNAVQLAVAAGYDVISTASAANAEAIRRLGARHVVDHRSATAVDDAVAALRGRRLAGALALGEGSAEACSAVLAAGEGRRVVAVATGSVSFEQFRRTPLGVARVGAQLGVRSGAQRLRDRRRGVQSRFIWGASLMDDAVGPALFERYLPGALASGSYVPWPPPLVVGEGLGALQEAFEVHRRGVSARKVVVRL